MKLLAVFLIAAIALASAQGPSKISSNNVGDIVNVDVNARANINNTVDATIVNVLLRFLNAQLISVGGGGNGGNDDEQPPQWPQWPQWPPNLPNLPTPPPVGN
jgi:hypothetical protein